MVTIQEYVSVRERAETLGCRAPEGLAILPRNFDTADRLEDLLHEGTESTVRKLFRQSDVPVSRLEPEGARLGSLVQKSADFVAPIIFVGASLYSNQPEIVNIALSVVGNYVTDMLKGSIRKPQVKCAVVIEQKDGLCKKVDYEGPVEGLPELVKVVREVGKNG